MNQVHTTPVPGMAFRINNSSMTGRITQIVGPSKYSSDVYPQSEVLVIWDQDPAERGQVQVSLPHSSFTKIDEHSTLRHAQVELGKLISQTKQVLCIAQGGGYYGAAIKLITGKLIHNIIPPPNATSVSCSANLITWFVEIEGSQEPTMVMCRALSEPFDPSKPQEIFDSGHIDQDLSALQWPMTF